MARERRADQMSRFGRCGMRTAGGLRNYFIDQANSSRSGADNFSADAAAATFSSPPVRHRIAAILGRDHRVARVLLHQHRVRDAERDRAAQPPSPITHATIGTVARAINSRLCAIASICPRSSAPTPDSAPWVSISVISAGRSARPIRKRAPPCDSLRERLAEIALDSFGGRAAALMPHDRDRAMAKVREARDDRAVVGEMAVAVDLDKVAHQQVDVIERLRTIRMPRQAHTLDRTTRLLSLRLGRRDSVAAVLGPRGLCPL